MARANFFGKAMPAAQALILAQRTCGNRLRA